MQDLFDTNNYLINNNEHIKYATQVLNQYLNDWKVLHILEQPFNIVDHLYLFHYHILCTPCILLPVFKINYLNKKWGVYANLSKVVIDNSHFDKYNIYCFNDILLIDSNIGRGGFKQIMTLIKDIIMENNNED